MNNSILYDDLLDLWLDKKISLKELSVQSGKNITEIEQETEQHLVAVKAIEYASIRQQLSSVHTRYTNLNLPNVQPAETKIIPINRSKWIARIAASVAVFMGLYVAQDALFVSPEKMYQSHFQEYYMNVERSTEVAVSSSTIDAFNVHNFEEVIRTYGNLTNPTNGESFLAGYANLKTGRSAEAENLFKTIMAKNLADKTNLYQDEAEYYLALTYLKMGNTKEAYGLMQKIKDDTYHTFNESISNWDMLRLKWFK